MHLGGKTFLVTGAGSGMGRQLTLALVAKGARVAAVDIHTDTLEETRTLAGEQAGNISVHVLDITDTAAVEALPQAVLAAHTAIDGVINNAGIIQPFVRVNDLDNAAMERVMRVNFYGALHIIKLFLPLLLQRPEAYLVNVSSMGGFLPVPGQSLYGASKAALKLLTEGLTAELADTQVHVSVVFPGAIATNITTNSGVDAPKISGGKEYKALPAEKAAEIILRGIEKNTARIFVGKDAKMMDVLYRVNPEFARKLITKQMKNLLT